MDKGKQWESIVAILTGLIVCYWLKRANGWLVAAMLIGILSLLIPAVAQGIHWGWSKLALLLGSVSGKVLLTLVYVFILLPLAFIARNWGTMTYRRKAGGSTYFKERNHRYQKEDLINPW
jgi:hypothetical protein